MSDELVQRLQRALDFWMPAIAGGEGPDSERAASDAAMLIGLEKYQEDCYGDRMLDEIDRLRAEVADWRRQAMQRSEDWREQNARADKAESALAALRKRVEEAPVGAVFRMNYFGREQAAVYVTAPDGFAGERVALVVLDEG